MSFIPFLIGTSTTGLDLEAQPWQLPDDAMTELNNGFVYRGVVEKRNGYNGYAIGLKMGQPYCESRMIHALTATPSGAIPGTVYTFNLTDNVMRGSVVVTGSNPVQVVTDNGLGGFTGDGTGTIDYTTGVGSITFNDATIAASTVTLAYNAHQGFPVLGVINFFKADDLSEMLVADTTYVNRYSPLTNRLIDITPAVPYTGAKSNFWSWTNYSDALDDPRVLFVNYKNQIQQYSGGAVSDYVVGIVSAPITSEAVGVGNGTVGPYTHTAANIPLKRGSITITAGAQVLTDDSAGNLICDITSGTSSGICCANFSPVCISPANFSSAFPCANSYIFA